VHENQHTSDAERARTLVHRGTPFRLVSTTKGRRSCEPRGPSWSRAFEAT
jgi:hypothetical protein